MHWGRVWEGHSTLPHQLGGMRECFKLPHRSSATLALLHHKFVMQVNYCNVTAGSAAIAAEERKHKVNHS